jgi:hypothetical protein
MPNTPPVFKWKSADVLWSVIIVLTEAALHYDAVSGPFDHKEETAFEWKGVWFIDACNP